MIIITELIIGGFVLILGVHYIIIVLWYEYLRVEGQILNLQIVYSRL